MAQSVKHLPLAQVMISGSWDQVLHWAPCSAGSLLLPLPLPSLVISLSLCKINKIFGGAWVAQSLSVCLRLRSWDQAPTWATCSAGSLILPLPLLLPLLVLSLSVI